ncbi:hypothetical protein QT969_20805 [Rhodococcus sp. CSLK01-03]|uniref:HNH endonuclease n=1 Tax=Rhodococcus indonesiensis TaxID=3055869 RepID=A0ABT7RSW3_9NOCA|nr:hypothetical protein [Rhodococcus indonesiensis]MDM7490731.1 hypothetical protein [Rhodococcus indonesiensis]
MVDDLAYCADRLTEARVVLDAAAMHDVEHLTELIGPGPVRAAEHLTAAAQEIAQARHTANAMVPT